MTRLTDEHAEALRGTIFEDDLLTGHIMDSATALRLLAEAAVLANLVIDLDANTVNLPFELWGKAESFLESLKGGDE